MMVNSPWRIRVQVLKGICVLVINALCIQAQNSEIRGTMPKAHISYYFSLLDLTHLLTIAEQKGKHMLHAYIHTMSSDSAP